MTIATGGSKARWPSIRRSCSLFDQAFPETAPGLLRRLIDHLIVAHHRGGGRRLRLDRLLGDRSRFRLNRFGIRRFRFKLRRRSRRDLGYRLRCRFGRRGFTCRQRFGLGGGPKVPLASMGHLGDQLLPWVGDVTKRRPKISCELVCQGARHHHVESMIGGRIDVQFGGYACSDQSSRIFDVFLQKQVEGGNADKGRGQTGEIGRSGRSGIGRDILSAWSFAKKRFPAKAVGRGCPEEFAHIGS